MKYTVALLIAAVSAGPPAYNEPPFSDKTHASAAGLAQAQGPPAFNEPPFSVNTHPSAAGLIQLNFASACAQSGLNGITCGPSDEELFADGMKGDADLELKIQMKGDKFDTYNQKLLMIESAEEPVETNLFATGFKGDEKFVDPDLKIQMKGTQFDTYKYNI